MLGLSSTIDKIEDLLRENSKSSITYAALECRLAIEKICYERLRLAHDYISHDDLKKWQPRDIVKVLIQEVDSMSADTFTISVSKSPIPEGLSKLYVEDYRAMHFLPIGTQIGFNPNRMGNLWNALANLALHISLPEKKEDNLHLYGNQEAIRIKVVEALAEIRRINEGTLMWTGLGEEISFECFCGTKNKRRFELLTDGQVVSCIDPKCNESYCFEKSDRSFGRRTFDVTCRACKSVREIPNKLLENLHTDKNIHFDCDGCGETIYVSWRPMQSQKTVPSDLA